MDDQEPPAAGDAAVSDAPRKPPHRLVGLKAIDPFNQGQLDHFCGLYAAVNALRLIALARGTPFERERAATLFGDGIDYLDERGLLPTATKHGCDSRVWFDLTRELCRRAELILHQEVALAQPFKGSAGLPKRVVLDRLRIAMDHGQPVLARFRDQYMHRTVIAGVGNKRLRLFDSGGLHSFSIADCDTDGSVRGFRHSLDVGSLLIMGP